MTERTRKPDTEAQKLFISYNSRDHEAVGAVRERLRELGVASFLDREQLIKGLPWPQALEQALAQVSAVAVFIGRHDLGIWQKREMGFALDRQGREEEAGTAFPVIPVLLPGSDATSGFLFLNTWVDLRKDLLNPQEIDGIVRAIGGEARHRASETRVDLLPYRGLQIFREQDAAFFCGRETFTERLVDAVLSGNLVTVVGPSGSGKSSVVQAGLLPKLRKRQPPADTWDAVIFTPGDRPYRCLADALIPLLEPDYSETDRQIEASKLGKALARGDADLESVVERLLQKSEGSDRLLLVADQFEELFTTTPDADRHPFIERLLQALERTRLTVVVTLRADFYGHALNLSRAFSDCIARGLVNLGPMTREELARSIRDPASRVGLGFESGLETRILDDLADQPGNLPLLEFALTELWAQRQGDLLTYAGYEAIGGVTGALAKRAESEYASLTPDQQRMARRLFTRLVRVAGPEDGNEDTRRRAELSELDPGAEPIVRRLTAARLLVTSGSAAPVDSTEIRPEASAEASEQQTDPEATQRITVEVAHEALIRGWEQLRGWLNEDREFLLWRQRLSQARTQWKQMGSDTGSLLRGAALGEAERWLHHGPEEINKTERAFIQVSLDAQRQEQEALERRRRNLLWGMTAGLIVAIGIAGFAFFQWDRADTQTKRANQQWEIAEARRDKALRAESLLLSRLSREQLASGSPASAVRLALAALPCRISEPDRPFVLEAEAALHQALADTWEFLRLDVDGPPVSVWYASFTKNGQRVMAIARDNIVRVWDAETGAMVGSCGEGNFDDSEDFWLYPQEVETDGGPVATVSRDGIMRFCDAETGSQLAHPPLDQLPGRHEMLAFSLDGAVLAAEGSDGAVRLLDMRGNPIAALEGHRSPVIRAEFTPDGRSLVTVTEGDTIRLWSVAKSSTATILQPDCDNYPHFRIAPDSRRIVVVCGTTGHLWKIDAETANTLIADLGPIVSATFMRNGHRLLIVSVDQPAQLWDADSGRVITNLAQQGCSTSGGCGLSFSVSSDGGRLATRSGNAVHVWDTDTGARLATLDCNENQVENVDLSPDGLRLVATSPFGPSLLWNLETLNPVGEALRLDAPADTGVFSSDHRLLATGSGEGKVFVWEVATGRLLIELPGWSRRGFHLIGFSPDDEKLLTVTGDSVRIWDLTRRLSMKLLRDDEQVSDVEISSDGRRFASRSTNGEAILWNARTGERLTAKSDSGTDVAFLMFSPDGRRLILLSNERKFSKKKVVAELWDTVAGAHLFDLRGHATIVKEAVFSPDSRRIATSSADRTIRVWDVKSGETDLVLGREDEDVSLLTFSPDGRTLAYYIGQSIEIRDSTTGDLVSVLKNHGDGAGALEFSPDGRRLVTKDGDRVRLWDTRDWTEIRELEPHDERIGYAHEIVFSPDGNRVLTVDQNATVRLYASQTGELLKTLRAEAEIISAEERGEPPSGAFAAFSQDGRKIIATSMYGRIVRIWNAQSGELLSLIDSGDLVDALTLSPDGTLLYASLYEGIVRVWDAATGVPFGTFSSRLYRHGLWDRKNSEMSPIAFSPDGTTLIIDPVDAAVRLSPVLPRGQKLIDLARRWVPQSLTPAERGRSLPSLGLSATP